jgi:hypothetical protein
MSRKFSTIREQVTAATCALVGVAASARASAVELDSSLLYYSEGSRVTVNELVGKARWTTTRERIFSLGVVVDIMTGASANGATPSSQPQTFTRPSGRGGYVVLPGSTPLDDTFQDNRVAIDAGVETPLGRRSRLSAGGHASYEYDYRSLGAEATLTRDFNRRNTTVALGGAFSYDMIVPEGGIPEPFAAMRPAGETPARVGDSDSKVVADLLAGVTQVVDRSTIARINYTLSHSSGYHTDPFKLLSVLDDTGLPQSYRFEHRPDTRTRHSIYAIIKRMVAGDVAETSYRFMRDDWGISSHTAELRYRHRMGGWRYLQPQYRFYHQTGADFFAPYLDGGAESPGYASSDHRLDRFSAHTVALKVGTVVGDNAEVSLRLGYYRQVGERAPPATMEALRGLDLFADLDAFIIQVGYSRSLE